MAVQPKFGPIRILTAEEVTAETFPSASPVVWLYRHWQALAPGHGVLPGRQHLDPLDIDPQVMPWIFILDVLDGPGARRDFVFRLVGTGNVTLVGRDATGKRASEIFGRTGAPFVLETFDRTVATAAPTFWIATVPHDAMGDVTIHRGLFPMARDGRTVDMLLCVAAPWSDG